MNPTTSRYIVVSLLWVAFFVFGIQLAGIGPLISNLAERTGSAPETVGIMFTIQSLGSLASALMIGAIVERFSVRAVILAGLISVAIGMFGISISETLPALLISAGIGGFGIAFMDVGGQLLIVNMFSGRSARPLSTLHFMFSIGAVAGPFLAVQVGLNMLLGAVFILLVIMPGIYIMMPTDINIAGTGKESTSTLYRSPILWFMALLVLLYVGLESSISNWTTEYLADTAHVERDIGGYVTSGYWFMFMISRLLVTAIGNRVSFERQLWYCLGLAIFGTILYALTVGHQFGATLATLIIGFSFGPVYPAAFSVVTRRFSSNASRAAGVIGIAGSIGAMIIAPVQGFLLKQVSGTVMVLYIVVLAAAMFGCYILAKRQQSQPA